MFFCLQVVDEDLLVKKGDWENTVKKDSMIWTTVSDLRGVNGNLPINYVV